MISCWAASRGRKEARFDQSFPRRRCSSSGVSIDSEVFRLRPRGPDDKAVKQFVGVADCHGIESFRELTEREPVGSLVLRAGLNRHRHAVAFQATISGSHAKEIRTLMDAGKYMEALATLRLRASKIGLANAEGGKRESWALIPDPSLDPYSEESIRTAWSTRDRGPQTLQCEHVSVITTS